MCFEWQHSTDSCNRLLLMPDMPGMLHVRYQGQCKMGKGWYNALCNLLSTCWVPCSCCKLAHSSLNCCTSLMRRTPYSCSLGSLEGPQPIKGPPCLCQAESSTLSTADTHACRPSLSRLQQDDPTIKRATRPSPLIAPQLLPVTNQLASPLSPAGAGQFIATLPGSPAGLLPISLRSQGFSPVTNLRDNPPCNTLFIGNLGDNVNENELRALLSPQPGYR